MSSTMMTSRPSSPESRSFDSRTSPVEVVPPHYLQEILLARGPRSLRTACLLNKPSRRKIDVKVDYIGFTIEDRFVVGYGLDYAEQYRNLPYIGILE